MGVRLPPETRFDHRQTPRLLESTGRRLARSLSCHRPTIRRNGLSNPTGVGDGERGSCLEKEEIAPRRIRASSEGIPWLTASSSL